MTAKEILQKVKAIFEAPVAPAATTPTPVDTPFKLKDGTDIMIGIDDPATSTIPDSGDMVTIGGNPAPEGDYTMEDGTTFTVDATGAITMIAQPAPITLSAEEIAAAEAAKNIIAPVQLAAESPLTAEAVQSMYAKFATGTPEERIANLETMVKALMECNFGYEIRKGQDATAIQVYKDSLASTQATVATQTNQLQLANQKIIKQDEVIAGLFEFAEKISELPTAEPKTLTDAQKEKFEKQTTKDKRLRNLADNMKKIKTQYNTATS